MRFKARRINRIGGVDRRPRTGRDPCDYFINLMAALASQGWAAVPFSPLTKALAVLYLIGQPRYRFGHNSKLIFATCFICRRKQSVG